MIQILIKQLVFALVSVVVLSQHELMAGEERKNIGSLLAKDVNSPDVQLFVKSMRMELDSEITRQCYKNGKPYVKRKRQLYRSADGYVCLETGSSVIGNAGEVVYSIILSVPLSGAINRTNNWELLFDPLDYSTPDKLKKLGRADVDQINSEGTGVMAFTDRPQSVAFRYIQGRLTAMALLYRGNSWFIGD